MRIPTRLYGAPARCAHAALRPPRQRAQHTQHPCVAGPNPYAKGYSATLSHLLTQAERHCDQPEWAAAFLEQLPRLACALGLQLVPHFRRLMPLLLGWLSAPPLPGGTGTVLDRLAAGCEGADGEGDAEASDSAPASDPAEDPAAGAADPAAGGPAASLRLLALQGLYQVVCNTWPRMPAHAAVLWRRLERLLPELESAPSPGDGELQIQEMEWLERCAEALWCCGGEDLRTEMGGGRLARLVLPLPGEGIASAE